MSIIHNYNIYLLFYNKNTMNIFLSIDINWKYSNFIVIHLKFVKYYIFNFVLQIDKFIFWVILFSKLKKIHYTE